VYSRILAALLPDTQNDEQEESASEAEDDNT